MTCDADVAWKEISDKSFFETCKPCKRTENRNDVVSQWPVSNPCSMEQGQLSNINGNIVVSSEAGQLSVQHGRYHQLTPMEIVLLATSYLCIMGGVVLTNIIGSVGHKLEIRAARGEGGGGSFGRRLPPGGTSCPACGPPNSNCLRFGKQNNLYLYPGFIVYFKSFWWDCWSLILSILSSACVSIIGTCVKIASIYISPPSVVNMAKTVHFIEVYNQGIQLL